MYMSNIYKRWAPLWALCFVSLAAGQSMTNPMSIRLIAEVELHSIEQGREITKLAPADRVVPGDQVIYTLQVRNTGATTLPPPVVSNPIPTHMRYVTGSAVGPGTVVSYSIDGGRTFDQPGNLKIQVADGQERPAIAADYTDIRWQLKNSLKGNSVAFVRFRAVVK
jgi:uncharacterized repeat protein (TIGR01451 family)